MDGQDPKEINTGGGAVSGGDIQTGGGDFVGRDQYIQYYPLDIPKLVAALKETLPSDDPAPQHLLETLQSFQHFHRRLYEWKEVHNYYNDITTALGQFSREIERLEASREEIDSRALKRLWRPVAQKVGLLLDWSAQVQFISETPFEQSSEGLKGPPWAVEICVTKSQMDELLQRSIVEILDLYDATFDFLDVAEKNLYLADKQLRETAGEIYNLSRIVLGSLEHG